MATSYIRGTFGQSPLPALPGAGVNSGLVSVVTPDDNLPRRLTGVYISDQTRLGHTQIFNGQRRVADIMHELFAVVDSFVTLDEDYAPGIQFAFTTFNDSAGAMTANTGVTLRYSVQETPAPTLVLGN